MALRKFPYGYEMKNGEIQICESEAETVRYIFTQRSQGKSNQKIAKELFEKSEAYFGDSVNKNSCKISSILYDKRYIGEDGYEQIVDKKLFDKVQKMKGESYCKKGCKEKEKVKAAEAAKATTLIPTQAVFEKEKRLKEMLNGGNGNAKSDNADSEQIRKLIFELAEEKYNCIV